MVLSKEIPIKIVSKLKKIVQEPFQTEQPALPDCVAVGKFYNNENLNLDKLSRPAPMKLFEKATKSSAPKSKTEIFKFWRQEPAQPPNQSAARTNFEVASKKTDWTAP